MRFVYCLPYFVILLIGCQEQGSADIMAWLNNKIDNRDESAAKNRDRSLLDDIRAHPVRFNGDTVILDNVHLASVKMSRYQPSFTLQGIIAPIQSINLTHPHHVAIHDIFIKSGDRVKKDDIIAHLIPIQSEQASNEKKLSPNDGQIIELIAPFDGTVSRLYLDSGMTVSANTPLVTLIDESQYQFISRLPAYLKPHLQIGKMVEISVNNVPFSGQITQVNESPNSFSTLDANVKILPKKDSTQKLSSGQFAKGIIEYGQISVGALVPEFSIINDDLKPLNLTKLYASPHKPQVPIAANIWVVKQNAQLTLSRVYIIEYLPDFRRFLVSGITEDSLIVLAPLPKYADGKHVVID